MMEFKTIKELLNGEIGEGELAYSWGYLNGLQEVLKVIGEVCRKGCPDIANLIARIEG